MMSLMNPHVASPTFSVRCPKGGCPIAQRTVTPTLRRSPVHVRATEGSRPTPSMAEQKAKKEQLRQKCEVEMNATVERLSEAAASGTAARATTGKDQSILDGSMELKSKIAKAVDAMQSGLVERDVEVRLLLLAALSGEHILYLGPPGTAKSELGRRLSRLTKGVFFERLLTRFSVPEELFGPLSMRALEEDVYLRMTEGYLPKASVAFIDEIFKANSAILNTLLTILNERLYDNGSTRETVPLLCLVGASNELPESEELDALYDRFLLRKAVKQVSPGGLAEMLQMTAAIGDESSSDASDLGDLLSEEEFRAAKAEALKTVTVPKSVVDTIADLRQFLQEKVEPPVYVSDRRLVKAINMLRVAAYCDGRTEVSEADCLLLQHVLWQRPEEAERIYDYLLKQLSEGEDNKTQFKYILAALFGKACRHSSDKDPGSLQAAVKEVGVVRGILEDRLLNVYRAVEHNFPQFTESLWMSEEESRAMATTLLPRMERSKGDVERLLFDAVVLEIALQEGAAPVTLAELLPKYWADFIRHGPIEDVSPLGLQ